jgi:hypothetical protein
MSKIIQLPDDLAKSLTDGAARAGMSLDEYAIQLLQLQHSPPKVLATPRTGADLVSYWNSEGLIGTRTDIADSSAYARSLREAAQRPAS